MQFGIFSELQLPRPWPEGAERRGIHEALEQVQLADRLGIEYAWVVEHHFLEEYSHSSAPEVFLAACSQLTHRIRLGHGIVLSLPAYNHPVRIAERVAMLDIVSNGRLEWGTGESSSRMELEGFGIAHKEKREMWTESVREITRMLSMDVYPGFNGTYLSVPQRSIVPKPLQKPHPPLWVACSNRDTIRLAAHLGIGALTFAFLDPDEAGSWVKEYYDVFKSDCCPIGLSVNPNIAIVTNLLCTESNADATSEAEKSFGFFQYALKHYYISGAHSPGVTDLWEEYCRVGPSAEAPAGLIGTPAEITGRLRRLEQVGVDQVILIHQAGNLRHELICDSLRLFASEVMPAFTARHAENAARKAAELEPYIHKALSRIQRPSGRVEPVVVPAYPLAALRAAAGQTAGRLQPDDQVSIPGATGEARVYSRAANREGAGATEPRSFRLQESRLYGWKPAGGAKRSILVVDGPSEAADLLPAKEEPAAGPRPEIETLISLFRRRGHGVRVLHLKDHWAPISAQAQAVRHALRVVSGENPSEEITILGIGLGGLAARYALALEEAGGGPVADRVVSFAALNSPHQGMNLSVGLQAGLWVAGGSWAERILNAPSLQSILTQWVGPSAFSKNRHRFPVDHSITAVGSARQAFLAELRGINGDGYPHRIPCYAVGTVRTDRPRPAEGEVLFRVSAQLNAIGGRMNWCQEEYRARPEDTAPGLVFPLELLPQEVQLGALRISLERRFDPAFIPLASALDQNGGGTPFAATLTAEVRADQRAERLDEVGAFLLQHLGAGPG